MNLAGQGMDDEELEARLNGLRIALAFAIKAASPTPSDVTNTVAALKEIVSLIPSAAHPAVKDELRGVLVALTRLPVRDPAGDQHPPGLRERQLVDHATSDPPSDLLV